MAHITVRSPDKAGDWVRRILRIWPDEEVTVVASGGNYRVSVTGDYQKELDAMYMSEYYRAG